MQGPAKRGDGWFGKSADFKTTVFDAHTPPDPGQIVPVEVKNASAHALYGSAVTEGFAPARATAE